MNSIKFYDETYIIEKAKAKRKCHTCLQIIYPKEICLKHLEKDILPDCRAIWKKKNLCVSCGTKVLNSNITKIEKFKKEFLRMKKYKVTVEKRLYCLGIVEVEATEPDEATNKINEMIESGKLQTTR